MINELKQYQFINPDEFEKMNKKNIEEKHTKENELVQDLDHSKSINESQDDNDDENNNSITNTNKKYKEVSYIDPNQQVKVSKIFSSFFSMFIIILLSGLIFVINLAFIGKVDNSIPMLEAIGLSDLWIRIFISSFLIGIIYGIESIGVKAFDINKVRILGKIYFSVVILICLMAVVLLVISLPLAGVILKVIFNGTRSGVNGNNSNINSNSTNSNSTNSTNSTNNNSVNYNSTSLSSMNYFNSYFILAAIACVIDVMYTLNAKILLIIKRSHIPIIISFITLILHIVWAYLFISLLDLGVLGAAISLLITSVLNYTMSMVYIFFIQEYKEIFLANGVVTWESITNYYYDYYPLALKYFFYTLIFEAIAIFCLIQSDIVYTGYIVLYYISIVILLISTAFESSLVLNASNFYNHQEFNNFSRVFNFTLLFNNIVIIIVLGILYLLKDTIQNAFVINMTVSNLIGDCYIFFLLYVFLASNVHIYNGYFRAIECNLLVFWLFIGCYIIIGFPSCYFLAVHLNWKLKGIFMSLSGICLVNLIMLILFTCCYHPGSKALDKSSNPHVKVN